uniref:Uncharacterized protein n=1 Tax=Aedes aegypti TaxID=7159 RepID=A0A0P6JRP3_AEDAE
MVFPHFRIRITFGRYDDILCPRMSRNITLRKYSGSTGTRTQTLCFVAADVTNRLRKVHKTKKKLFITNRRIKRS